MKAVFTCLFCLLLCPLAAHDLTPAVNDLACRPVLRGASWAAAAAYTDGKSLFSVRPDLRLAPASTLKLLTSAAALDALGPFYRFQTRIYADAAPDENGVLYGNLYIRGAGDPTLGSSRVQGSLSGAELLKDWSRQVRNAGIKKINGGIYADVSMFSGPSLPDKTNWQNMGNYFAAPATALAFNDNAFTITFEPQARHGAAARIQSFFPRTEGLKIRSFVTADAKSNKDNAYVYAAPGQYEMEIYGTIPAARLKGFSIQAALPDAPQLLADLFQRQLEEDGVSVDGSARVLEDAPDYGPMTLLFTHYSAPLKDIIYVVNKRSFNFYAEMLLRQLAVRAGKAGSINEGLVQLRLFLERNGINTQDAVLYDGSGLSRDNQLTVQILLDVLRLMSKHRDFAYFYDSLATPDDRGDLLLLRKRLSPSRRTRDVRVKGGTLDGVKAQAGYVKDKNGRLIAFAAVANNLAGKDEAVNRFYEDIINLLLQTSAEPDAQAPAAL